MNLQALLERPMTAPDPAVLDAITAGPIDPAQALALADIDRLLDPAPLPVETGWCRLPDGVAYTAVRTELPGVTGDMVDWWFDWHQRDPIRYQVWFPGAHESTSWEPAASAGAKQHWGTVHFPVEDVGLGMETLRIAFFPPTRLGFSTDALDDPNVATIVGGHVASMGKRMQHTLMVHVFLNGEHGLVQRSRFWLGAVLRPLAPSPVADLAAKALNRPSIRRRVVPDRAPRLLAEHCAREYTNLGALLPELYP